jgi:hypothetical protein
MIQRKLLEMFDSDLDNVKKFSEKGRIGHEQFRELETGVNPRISSGEIVGTWNVTFQN